MINAQLLCDVTAPITQMNIVRREDEYRAWSKVVPDIVVGVW